MLDMADAKRRLVNEVAGKSLSVAIVGNFPPRRCGIATFTSDLFEALGEADEGLKASVYAMSEPGADYAYPDDVAMSIRADEPAAYLEAAARINASDADVVCVQHEYGIFGGPAGAHLLLLLDRVRQPVVATLHTVLTRPDPDQRRVLQRLIARAAKIVVMSEKARQILLATYDAPPRKVALVPHGAPDRPLVESAPYKAALGLSGRDVLLTFGLLGPSKGLEDMIRALPRVVATRPHALYVILGATHPHIVAREGEAYREGLMALATELGVADNVAFVNAYVDQDMLIRYLCATDVYVTPYPNEAQVTSGTLAYAVALGKPVVSTPFWHAQELLADERGVLTPFGDPASLAANIVELLCDDKRRDEIRSNAYAAGRATTWARCADRYLQLFGIARAEAKRIVLATPDTLRAPPRPRLDAVARMSDDCGIAQHGVFNVADRRHGYCLDDCARALALATRLNAAGLEAERARALAPAYAAFVQHAWNEDLHRFRNFMGFDRRWLEDKGSPDSCGRALQTLGLVAAGGLGDDYARWARVLFERAFPHARDLAPLRAQAFAALGAIDLLEVVPDHPARALVTTASASLKAAFEANARAGWRWFEPTLAYDNARLPELMLRAARVLNDRALGEIGVETLSWLCQIHTGAGGCFRPVGSESFGAEYAHPEPFDQQPLEAAAVIDACAAAYAFDGAARWPTEAQRALDWFFGENDLGTALADAKTGDCLDGLGRHGPNLNQGAESILSFQSALVSMHALVRAAARDAKDVRAR